jgi:hypothetical protein
VLACLADLFILLGLERVLLSWGAIMRYFHLSMPIGQRSSFLWTNLQ